MLSTLRPYQQDLYLKARQALLNNRAVCLQLHTGGGKTAIASEMIKSVYDKQKLAWFITPRKELVKQASEHLSKWGVIHNKIDATSNESRGYNVHVVSKETLVRRWDKIKNWPHLIIIDEAHINLDFQIELYSRAPEYCYFITFTATPERSDGRGLSKQAGGIADILIEGPSIPDLTDAGYLSSLRYFSPPIEGLSDLHTKGTEYDEEELEALLERRKIYGELVGHYEKYGKGKPALIFCRSVKSAYQTAERFRDKGFNFHCIEGKMTDTKRRELINALTAGTIDGLTNCEIATYGLDIPRIEYGASIRPTLSRALYCQMIGRILRPYTDNKTGYKKEEALFFDHVNLILEHQDPNYPGTPLHYIPHIEWNFHGTEKRKKNKSDNNVKLCPHLDFMYCNKPHCTTCEHNPDKSVKDARRPMIIVPAELEEKSKPVYLSARPPEERKEISDRITSAVQLYNQDINHLPNVITELLQIADECGYRELWVYHQLTETNRHTVNVPILSEICRQRNYKPGWVWFARQKLKTGA